MIATGSATEMSASAGLPDTSAMAIPFVRVWQLEEDLRFPLYRQWTKPTKEEPLSFQRDRLPLHDINWHNRETRRSKWFKKQGEKR